MLRGARALLSDLAACLSEAIDLIAPQLYRHHQRVAYIAFSVGRELGLPDQQCRELALAGMLHDVGAISLEERLALLNFEADDTWKDDSCHAEIGYHLLKVFAPFATAAQLVRYHHEPWGNAQPGVPESSHVLHLADRVAALFTAREGALGLVAQIVAVTEGCSGSLLRPEVQKAFSRLAQKEHFWLDLAAPRLCSLLTNRMGPEALELDLDDLLDLGKLFSHIIDFRCPFTATHSRGVAAVAETLGGLLWFSDRECQMLRVAGYLHDLGKLAVPTEILYKADKLTEEEFALVRSHAFHTYRILEPVAALEIIAVWGSLHHERLHGAGYPFRHVEADLPLGSRIMAVADVYTALTEDRPYRPAMDSDAALRILGSMAAQRDLDARIVSVVGKHMTEIDAARTAAQASALHDYRELRRTVGWGVEA